MQAFQPVKFGKYLLLDQIAVGGMAELYRAKLIGDEGFEKLIAIKKILPHLVGEDKLIKSFIDEARLAAFLEHENIIRIYDFGKNNNDLFIAMEYLSGKNLRDVIEYSQQKSQPIGLGKTLYIILCICNGLHYAHNLKDFSGVPLNIIHRDISPPNIFITYGGDVKIIDFGIAKASSQNTATQIGTIKGKVAYMSPEQATGDELDRRSDVFAIGVILYEMVTGKKPFEGDTFQVLAKVRNADFEPPEKIVTGIPASLNNIILKSLAKDLQERYQSCGDMLVDLEKCMAELGLRTNAWSFTRYVKTLFTKEIEFEEKVLQNVAALSDKIKVSVMQKTDATISLLEVETAEPVNKKICVFGAVATGKTSIVSRYCNDKIPEKYNFTAGVSICNKLMKFDGKNISAFIWDFCGEDRANRIDSIFFKGMDGYFLVLDFTRNFTINSVISIHERIEKAVGKLPFICLINKTDLPGKSDFKEDVMRELQGKGWDIISVSAKMGKGINRAFISLIEKMMDN